MVKNKIELIEKFSKEELLKRLALFLKVREITKKDLALAGSVSQKTITNIFAGSSSPNAKALAGWRNNLDLDTNWLLTGKGGMAAEGMAPVLGEDISLVAWLPNSLGKTNFLKGAADLACNMDEADDLAYLEALQAKTEARIAALRKDRGFYGKTTRPTTKEQSFHEESSIHNDGDACGIDTEPPTDVIQYGLPNSTTKR